MSKQQLQHSNIIKKLRVKEKESDARMTKQQRKIKEQEEELRQLQQVRFLYIFKNVNLTMEIIVTLLLLNDCFKHFEVWGSGQKQLIYILCQRNLL